MRFVKNWMQTVHCSPLNSDCHHSWPFFVERMFSTENDASSYVASTINPFTSLADVKWYLIFQGNMMEAMKNEIWRVGMRMG